MRLKRLERALETQIVLVERPDAPEHRRVERRHDDVEEHAVAVEAEAARARVVADQQLGRPDRLQPIADIRTPCSTAPSSTRSIWPI